MTGGLEGGGGGGGGGDDGIGGGVGGIGIGGGRHMKVVDSVGGTGWLSGVIIKERAMLMKSHVTRNTDATR